MKILAIEKDKEGVDWTNAKEILAEEAKDVYQLYTKGIVREVYFTENKNAILIIECESKEIAMSLLNALPLVKEGYTYFEFVELNPYTGYERLFSKQP